MIPELTLEGISQTALLDELAPDGLRVCSGGILPDKPPILLDNRNAHTADMAAQQALSDDAHHQQMVEFTPIEYTELRPGNKGDLVLGVEVGIKEDPSFNRPNPPSVHLDGPTSVRDAVVRLKKDRAVESALLGYVPIKGTKTLCNRTGHRIEIKEWVHGAVFFWIAPASWNHRAPAGSVGRRTFRLLDALQI